MENNIEQAQTNSQVQEDTPRSRISSIFIIILLVIAGFLAYNYVKTGQNPNPTTTPTPTTTGTNSNTNQATNNDQISPSPTVGQNEYVVERGDTLWKIAENRLNDGFLWKEIAKLNNIGETDVLVEGTKLTLPEVAAAARDESTPTPTTIEPNQPTPEPQNEPEVQDTTTTAGDQIYVVKKGDSLWKIAQEFYGDGAKWHLIYENQGNNLSMSSIGGVSYPLIHAGNVLIIPAELPATAL